MQHMVHGRTFLWTQLWRMQRRSGVGLAVVNAEGRHALYHAEGRMQREGIVWCMLGSGVPCHLRQTTDIYYQLSHHTYVTFSQAEWLELLREVACHILSYMSHAIHYAVPYTMLCHALHYAVPYTMLCHALHYT